MTILRIVYYMTSYIIYWILIIKMFKINHNVEENIINVHQSQRVHYLIYIAYIIYNVI